MNIQRHNPLASLTQPLGPLDGNLAYDESPHLHRLEPTQNCPQPTQHSWVANTS